MTTGGQFSIAGQRPSQTNVQIDGVDANNAFFGENRGGSRIPFIFSLESIREFQIITNGYDVEYGNYSGGIVNIVTKGGTNDFRARSTATIAARRSRPTTSTEIRRTTSRCSSMPAGSQARSSGTSCSISCRSTGSAAASRSAP